MSDVIRNVTVKVSIENGDMSGFDASPVMSAIKQAQQEAVASVQSSFTASASSAMQTMNEPLQASAIQTGQAPATAWNGTSPKIGMPGYGASVENRAAEHTAGVMNQMHAGGLLEGYSDDDLAKLEEQLQKRAAAFVREQDQETAAAEKEYDKQALAAIKAYSRIMAERNKKEKDAQKMRQEISDNEMDNIVRNAVNATKKEKAEDPNNPANRGGGNTFGEFISQVARAATVLKTLNETLEVINASNRIEAAVRQTELIDAQSAAHRDLAISRNASSAMSQTSNVVGRMRRHRLAMELPGMRETEAALRESDADVDNLSSERRQDIRRTTERNAAYEREKSTIGAQERDVTERQQRNAAALQMARERLTQHEQKRLSIESAFKAKISENVSSGGVRTQGQNDELVQLEIQQQQARVKSAQELKQTQEEINSLEQRNIGFNEQRVELAEKLVKVTREQKQAAYEDARNYREQKRQDEVSVGAMDNASQAKLKLVDKKITRIKQGSGEKLESWELQQGYAGHLDRAFLDQQSSARAARLGLKNTERTDEILKQKEDFSKSLESSKEEAGAEKQLEQATSRMRESVERSLQAIEAVRSVADMVEEFSAEMENLRARVEQIRARSSNAALKTIEMMGFAG